MAVKIIDLTKQPKINTALLLAAGVGYDSANNRLVSLHGTDVLFEQKDPESVRQYHEIVARAITMAASPNLLADLPNVACAMLRKDRIPVDNFHLMRMYTTDVDLAATRKMLSRFIGNAALKYAGGYIGRVAIVPLRNQPVGFFQLQATFCRTHRTESNWLDMWRNNRDAALLDEDFCKAYADAIRQISPKNQVAVADEADYPVSSLVTPTNEGVTALIDNDHELVYKNEVIGTDFVMVNFSIDKVFMSLGLDQKRLDDEVVKSKARLFVTSGQTLYDMYLVELGLQQIKKEYAYHRTISGTDETTQWRPVNAMPMIIDDVESCRALDLGTDPDLVVRCAGFTTVAEALSHLGREMVVLNTRLVERNRHTMIVHNSDNSWALIPMKGLGFTLKTHRYGIEYHVTDAVPAELRKLIREAIPEFVLAHNYAANFTLEDKETGAFNVEFTFMDSEGNHTIEGNLRHLMADVRDMIHNLMYANNFGPLVPAFAMTHAQVTSFGAAIEDELEHNVTGYRVVLNAMRRVFHVHNIPGMQGEVGDFMRKLEDFIDAEAAKEFVLQDYMATTAEYRKKMAEAMAGVSFVPVAENAIPISPSIEALKHEEGPDGLTDCQRNGCGLD